MEELFIVRIIAGIIILLVLAGKNKSKNGAQSVNYSSLTPALNATPTTTTTPATTTTTALNATPPTTVSPAVVDPDYFLSEAEIVKRMIEKEATANGININTITTKSMQRRKLINTVLFAIISFICISCYFFHFPVWTYLTELIVIFIYISVNRKYNAKDFLYKEVKARPDEKVSNIVASMLQENIQDTFGAKTLRFIVMLLPIIAIFFVYYEPHLLYEEAEDGYHVRFYTIGINGSDEIVVPEEYKGEKVTGIRGNVFANLKDVRKITLPDTITEIRGNSFRNDYSLEEINLPANLTYLGANAFYNCHALEEITIPSGVTEILGGTFVNCERLKKVNLHDNITNIHGESFINCKSLETIDLPPKITEIRGNTFQGCSSLDNIVIPEGVTRIGGHAFEDCSNLTNVTFPKTLKQIGSSAFRRCYRLKSVTIPSDTSVEANSFKENYGTQIYYFPTASPSGKEYNKYTELRLYIDYSQYVYGTVDGDYTVELVSIQKTNYYNTEYVLNFYSEKDNYTITLSSSHQSSIVNSNMEVERKYDNGSYIELAIYYN